MKLRYSAYEVIDGDTVKLMKHNGEWVTVRIIGLDTDELSGRHKKRGFQQKKKLEGFMKAFIKPRFKMKVTKLKKGGWKTQRDKYGRVLAKVTVWRWLWFVDYAQHMKDKKMVKRNSKWNI